MWGCAVSAFQSIVRELNDEKIDVIEWDADQKTFIAKALSPARVSHVFLDENPTDGKTAVVIVPDDQLSLAIGREGQNARLGAKLTGWRIDIKSLTEAAGDSLNNLDNPLADQAVVGNTQLIENVQSIIAKKAANRPITSEDYYALDRLVGGVEGKIIAARSAEHEAYRQTRIEARRSVPAVAWDMPLDDLDLPGRIHNLLLDNKVESVGAVMMVLAIGDEEFLGFHGLGETALETVKERIAGMEVLHQEPEVEETVEEAETVAEEIAEDEIEEAEAEVEAIEEEAVAEVEEVVEAALEEEEEEEIVEEETAEAEVEEAEPVVAEVAEPEVDAEPIDAIDDLSQSLVSKPSKEKKETQKGKVVIVDPSRSTPTFEDPDSKKGGKKRGRQLVLDEDSGEVVVKRKRKGSRKTQEWDDFDLDEIDDF